jgi:hypothetical protein
MKALNWTGLGDPERRPTGTCGVSVFATVVQKVLHKHVADSDAETAWKEIAPDGVIANLDYLLAQPASELLRLDHVGALLEVLRRQAHESLCQPLVLTYTCRRPSKEPRQRWLLVLPCGALMVLAGVAGAYVLVTCFFSKLPTPSKKPRWKQLLVKLVKTYGVFSPDGWVPPEASHPVVICPPNAVEEQRTGIRFITERAWGFCPELRGRPWRGAIGPWPAADSCAEPPQRRLNHSLKPRRPRKEQEDD